MAARDTPAVLEEEALGLRSSRRCPALECRLLQTPCPNDSDPCVSCQSRIFRPAVEDWAVHATPSVGDRIDGLVATANCSSIELTRKI